MLCLVLITAAVSTMSLIPAQSNDLSSAESEGNYSLTINGHDDGTIYNDLEEIIEIINNSEGGSVFTITLNGNGTIDSSFILDKDREVTLTSSTEEASKLTITKSERHFIIENGTLILEKIILDGNETGGGVVVGSSGELIMKKGAAIQNCTATKDGDDYYYGGGVYNDGGTFTMNGGVIKDNKAINKYSGSGAGGGVYNYNGTFAMNGGEISGNISGDGGGVYNYNGTFTMKGGKISDNTGCGVYNYNGTFTMKDGKISDNTGGGVYNYSGATFTMTGGEISGNTAGYNGAGVHNYYGSEFNMTAGLISKNISSGNGAGVNNYEGSTFTMTGGEISGNITEYNSGGGVNNIYSSTFTMTGGKISGNTAINGSGGGVQNNYSSKFNMNGGVINGNNKATFGGGVYNIGEFEMNGGEISENIATRSGGGVSNVTYNAKFEMIAGEISGNIATEKGGGIYGSDSVTNIKGGKISGNTAKLGGGLHVLFTSVVTITNGEISGNTAELGGGIYSTNSVINIKGGKISGNTATEADKNGSGGGIYTDNYASLTVENGVVFSSNTAPTLRTNNIVDDATLTYYINKISKKVVLSASANPKLNAPAYNNYDINYQGDALVVTIVIKPSSSGTVTATYEDKDTVYKNGYVYVPLSGDVITLSAIPKSGGKFIQFEIDNEGLSKNPIVSNVEDSIVLNVQENITVYATFQYREYSINVSADSGSEITPGGTVKVPYGFDEVFKFSAMPGYKITAVYVNGVPISSAELASGEYTFRNVKSNHTIEVVSEADDEIGGGSDIGAGGSGGSETGSGGNADGEWLIIGAVCVMLAVFSGVVALVVRRDRRRTDDS